MLHLNSVTYTYPNVVSPAVADVSLAVGPGELVLCTGRSGCGKSTLIRLLNGLAPHYYKGDLQGSVGIDGHDTRDRSLTEISSYVGTLFQNPETQFFALTVEDEAGVALECRGVTGTARETAVIEALESLGLKGLAEQSVLNLSEGQKQKVAMAGLLAAAPKALILDEPSANLDPEAALDLADILRQLKARGMPIFVADHRFSWLRDLADRVVVMDGGRIVAEGGFELLDDADLRARHGLRSSVWHDPRPHLPRPAASSSNGGAFTIDGLSFGFKNKPPLFDGLDLVFPASGIAVLSGPNGCGKTTLARLAAGLLKSKSAPFAWKGEGLPSRGRSRHVGLVLQNADHQLRMDSVRAELVDALVGLPRDEVESRTENFLSVYGLAPLADRHPQSLSGGEKQRLSVAAAMIRRPDVVFLDEPTSGLDGENMHRMGEDLRRAAREGAAVVVITHDLEFMAEICDCIVPLHEAGAMSETP